MSTTPLSHLANFSVTISLAALAVAGAGFSTVLFLVPLSANSLNGVRVAEYTTYSAMQTAQTAGYISAGTLAAGLAAFSQRPNDRRIESFKVGYVDIGGGETYATGLAACIVYDSDFYGVCITPRTVTEIAATSLYIETAAKKMVLIWQSADASWLDASAPASFVMTQERSLGVYHDNAAVWADVALACDRLLADPDKESAPWGYAPLRSVTAYTTQLTEAQRVFALANNINVGASLGGEDFVLDKGANVTGRPFGEIITADWFSTRTQELVSILAVQHSARFQKIIMDSSGQAKVSAVLEKLLQRGVKAAHFVQDQFSVVAEEIAAGDYTTQTLNWTVRAQIATNARLFAFIERMSRTPIADNA